MTKTATKHREPWKITEARTKRARYLSDRVMQWDRLRQNNEYPRSLVNILESSLEREYELGRKRGRREAKSARS